MERFDVIERLSTVPKKDIGLKAKPRTFFKFYLDDQKQLRYQKHKIIDLRWAHRNWQKGCESLALKLLQSPIRQVFIFVEIMARRHGKTYKSIHAGINLLPAIPRPNPVMAYYCPEKGQAIRNAWAALEAATRGIPNVHLDKTAGIITFPRPTLQNPQDYCTVYLLPMARGFGAKKGQYYDICIVDEADQANETFIKEVCIISVSDRGGILELKGTPDGHDILTAWMARAKKKVDFALAFDKGLVHDVPDDMVDFKDWSYFESHAEKEDVYSPEELKKLKAILGDEIYNNQMLCQDVVSTEKFYYRKEMAIVRQQKREIVTLGPEAGVPLRAYYDVGIGSKSDRMAFGIYQLFPTHVFCLWSWDEANCGYAEVAQALAQTPYGKHIIEHCVPHDMGSRQQSDKVLKADAFEKALRKYGIPGDIRILQRPTDTKGDLGLVRTVIGKTFFNSLRAESCITALNRHCRAYNKTAGVFEDRPSKTKYRDLADQFRHMAVDYENKEYINQTYAEQRTGKPKTVEIKGVEHSFQGSLMYNDDGTERAGPDIDTFGYVPTHLTY